MYWMHILPVQDCQMAWAAAAVLKNPVYHLQGLCGRSYLLKYYHLFRLQRSGYSFLQEAGRLKKVIQNPYQNPGYNLRLLPVLLLLCRNLK